MEPGRHRSALGRTVALALVLPILIAGHVGPVPSLAGSTPVGLASPAPAEAPEPTGIPVASPSPSALGPPAAIGAAAATSSPASSPAVAPSSDPAASPAAISGAPSPGPGGWITLSGHQGLLGLAGNGDVFVSVGRPGGPPEIRRLSPTGEILTTTTWDKRALRFGAYRWLVDPTDDSLVGFEGDPGRVMRMSLETGRVVRTFRIPDGLTGMAIDGQGRIHLVCRSVIGGSCYDIAGPGAVIVYDRTGKRLASRTLLAERGCVFAAPAFLARTTAGVIRALSTGFGRWKDEHRCARTPIRAVDLTPGLRLGTSYVIPYEKGYFASYLTDTDVRDMAGIADGRTFLLEVAMRNGEPVERTVRGILMFRHRLREIGPDGRVLRSWGHGGTEPGVEEPIEVEVAADGTIWVLDSDPVAQEAHTRYLPPGS